MGEGRGHAFVGGAGASGHPWGAQGLGEGGESGRVQERGRDEATSGREQGRRDGALPALACLVAFLADVPTRPPAPGPAEPQVHCSRRHPDAAGGQCGARVPGHGGKQRRSHRGPVSDSSVGERQREDSEAGRRK